MKDVVKKTLKNGVTCYLYGDEDLKRFAVSYGVNYGTLGYFDKFYYEDKLYEVPPSIAHFIEHTLIEKSKYGNFLFRLKDQNYMMNGATSTETTRYYFLGIEEPYRAIEELINLVDDPVFTREDVEDVKSAVAEETQRLNDNKYKIAQDLNMRSIFTEFEAIPENGNVLGSRDTTMSITYDDVMTAYNAYYSDDNKTLCIAGNFEIDKMVYFLEGVYAKIKPHPNKRKPFYEAAYIDSVRKEREVIYRPVANDYVYLSFKVKNDFGLSKLLLSDYLHALLRLKFGSDTKFVTGLANDKVIVGGISYSVYFFQDDILFITISADVLDEKEFTLRVKKELEREELDERTFELYKKSCLTTELSKMDYIYNSIIQFPSNIEFSETIYNVDVIKEMTYEGLLEVFKKLKWSVHAETILKKDKNKK